MINCKIRHPKTPAEKLDSHCSSVRRISAHISLESFVWDVQCRQTVQIHIRHGIIAVSDQDLHSLLNTEYSIEI